MEYLVFIAIYSSGLFFITLSNISKLNDKYIVYLIILMIFISSFRTDQINADALNYLYYFNSITKFDSFWEVIIAPDWSKIEPGFKALLYIVHFINVENSSLIYKISISLTNSVLFFYIFKANSKVSFRGFSIFLFLYTCFFLFIFNLTIIRFSIASSILLLAYQKLIYSDANRINLILLTLIAATFHIAAAMFALLLFYFHQNSKLKYKKIWLFIPFALVIVLAGLLKTYSAKLGLYYAGLWENQVQRVSYRIFIEIFIIAIVCYNQRKNDILFKIFKLNLVLYAFFAMIELYFGIHTLNRLRILAWFVFIYSLSMAWHKIHLYIKIFVITYALCFYVIYVNQFI